MKHSIITSLVAVFSMLLPAIAGSAHTWLVHASTAGTAPQAAPEEESARITISPNCPAAPTPWRLLVELQAGEDFPTYYERVQALWAREVMGKKQQRAQLLGYVLRNPQAPAHSRDIIISCQPREWSVTPLGFGAATSTGRFLIIEFTPQGIASQQARGEMSNGLKLDATGLRQT